MTDEYDIENTYLNLLDKLEEISKEWLLMRSIRRQQCGAELRDIINKCWIEHTKDWYRNKPDPDETLAMPKSELLRAYGAKAGIKTYDLPLAQTSTVGKLYQDCDYTYEGKLYDDSHYYTGPEPLKDCDCTDGGRVDCTCSNK